MNKNDKVIIVDTGDIWEGKQGKIVSEVDDGIYLVKVDFTSEGEDKNVIQEFNEENLKMESPNESLNENLNEVVNEDVSYEDYDFVHDYVYLVDLDDKELPAWNFAARIATAENIEEHVVIDCARENNYKIFHVEAPGFSRVIIAAKQVNLEDIQEEYTDFLQGNAVIYEEK